MRRIYVLVTGFLVWLVMFVIAAFSTMLTTSSIYAKDPEIWKATGTTWLIGIVLFYLLAGLVYTLMYTVMGARFRGPALAKGLLYGLIMWLIGPLPLFLIANLSVAVSTDVIVSALFSAILHTLAAGVLIAYLFDMMRGDTGGEIEVKKSKKR